MANVLAFAETRGGELRKVALEAVTAARQAADTIRGRSLRGLLPTEAVPWCPSCSMSSAARYCDAGT